MFRVSRKRKCISTSLMVIGALLMVVHHTNSQKYEKCLTSEPEVIPKKYLHYESKSLNITLETSSRITHQLSTHIFRIFLQEIVGYPKVEIYHHEDSFQTIEVLDRLSERMEDDLHAPRSMINLEVWVPPEVDTKPFSYGHYVKDCGNVAPPGRFGWFVPIQLTQPIWMFDKRWIVSKDQDIHWTLFKDRKFVSLFDITINQDLIYLEENSYNHNKESKEYFCNNLNCTRGMYIPEWCSNKGNKYVPCAVLLTSDYNSTKFVIEHIKELQLLVKVVWLGPNLKKVSTTLKDNYIKRNSSQSIVLLSWTPSEIIMQQKKYINVAFKHCELMNSSRIVGCKYELTQLMKFAWSKLEKLAEPAYQALLSFNLHHDDIDDLLKLYSKNVNKTIPEITCDWMRMRTYRWKQWKLGTDKKGLIYIGGIFPLSSSSYAGDGIFRSAVMARDAINRNTSILPDYTLMLFGTDGECRADKVMKEFIGFIGENAYNKLVGVLGPACSETVEPLAGVSKYYRTMVISYSAEGASFSNREKYPYFFRTIGENKQYKHVYLKLFQKFGWRQVAALTEDGQKYTEYISLMQDTLEENGITFISNTKFPREREVSAMTKYLEDLKRKRARIIIADVFDEVARGVMCEAYKLGMTSKQGYVWFLPLWLNTTWYNTNYFNEAKNESVNCTTENMIEAITGYLALTHAYYANDDAIMQENKTVGEWRATYVNSSRIYKTSISNYAGFAYDAVWVYALALDKLIKTDPEAVADLHSQNTTDKLVHLVKETDFNGVSGRIKFHGGPSRISVINIMQWYNNETHIVGQFYPNITDDDLEIMGGELKLNDSAIKWFTPDHKTPDDGTLPPPTCALSSFASFLNVECEMAIIILNLVCAALLVIFLVIAVMVIKKRYDKKVQLTEKYMKSLGIDLLNPSNISDLDKWEIARESVVINRKLGEGAFGTVYGGEANFPDSGWLAVAVKTLKVGSTTEEKLDFLSEAEVMKRFEHKNIVKLLGVCTKNEPVYTIMEFMLYGDLKTFLLARRHLVNEKVSEDSDEISSKKLTSMALDVARGLSYLAELKYVHRDVASRNCLVNAQRVVKLGDFGMTRPMFENDYYKFNRKGMLPVRWMSPESLALGVFTPSSDVWSYGVLLYEIITFGSFPFQGMSNTQVLEHVKAGNTLQIPQGVKPQLEGLIKSCWHQDGKMRPTASEIVEFLANNPRLLFPNLDVPLASVQMEDTDQLEMHLPEQFRKPSTSSFKSSPTMPNGITSQSFDSKLKTLRQNSAAESGISIQMDNCCPREPLLGPVRSNSSLLSFSKYVTIQHNRTDSGCEQEDPDYCAHSPANGHAVTKV